VSRGDLPVPRDSGVSTEHVRSLPKVELHVHLEGAISARRIAALATSAGEPDEVQLSSITELDELLSTLDWVCGLVRDHHAAMAVAHDFSVAASRQGTVYAEVIVNPTHWAGLHFSQLLPALAAGFDAAAAEGYADCRLLPSILREQSEDEAIDLVNWMGSADLPRLAGLSIDGNEAAAGRTAPRFASAFSKAADLGFGRTVHAGESSGPRGVADALDVLGATRIDHGVRSAEDPRLLERLARERVMLNVCLTSNATLLYESLDDHPIREILAAGVPVTFNTDDPELLDTTLCDEYELAAHWCQLNAQDLVATVHDGIGAAFCYESDKAELGRRLDEWATTIDA
jgi:adenosine deaminase